MRRSKSRSQRSDMLWTFAPNGASKLQPMPAPTQLPVILTGCTGPITQGSTTTPPHKVTVADFGYTPNRMQIKAGDTVTFTKNGPTAHFGTIAPVISWSPSPQMLSDTTQAGWATADITPQLPVNMGGYAARSRPAESTHDPLQAQALALGTPSEPLVVVVCDVLAVDASLVEQVQSRLKEVLPSATVWLAATHTHSGPSIGGVLDQAPPIADVTDRLLAGATRAAREAVNAMRPVGGGWVSTLVSGIGTNRDHPILNQKLPLDLLCLFDANAPHTASGGRPRAILGSFPCHPTVLDATNLALSADLPGAFRRSLTGALGGDTWVALATGAGGDISTRHTRLRQDFVELDRLGASLAEQALAALDCVEEVRLRPPRIQQRTIDLPARAPRSTEELQALRGPLAQQREAALQAGDIGRARTLETALQGLDAGARRTATDGGERIRALVAAASLGEVAVTAIPGELYYQLGSQLRQAHRGRAMVLAYTNGYIGYIPTLDAYSAIDYEVLMSPLAPGAGEVLRDTALQLLAAAIPATE